MAMLAVISFLAACGPRESHEPHEPGPLPLENGPYTVEPVTNGGVITGHCRLVGEPHPARFREWAAMGVEAGQDDESVAVGKGQALGGCFVSLAGIASGKEWPEAMRSDDRTLPLAVLPGRYEPHLAWVRVDTQVEVRSSLPKTSIYVRMLRDSQVIANFAADKGYNASPEQAFLRDPGLVHVTEDMRRAFNAWIVVSPHPYVEITSARAETDREPGEFRLDAVPPGDYELVCRHEPMDRVEQGGGGGPVWYTTGPPIEMRRRIYVRSGERTVVDFEVDGNPAPSIKSPPR